MTTMFTSVPTNNSPAMASRLPAIPVPTTTKAASARPIHGTRAPTSSSTLAKMASKAPDSSDFNFHAFPVYQEEARLGSRL
jgi:hypothetical protein